MNRVIEKAYELNKTEVWDCGYLPDLEVGEICTLNDIWDGERLTAADVLEAGSYHFAYQEGEWINYEFNVIDPFDIRDTPDPEYDPLEYDEYMRGLLDTKIKITNIELI